MRADRPHPDLSRRPPRSPRVRLGGYVHLPRLIDKARAVAAGCAGDYRYRCPFDERFFAFTGIEAEAMMDVIRSGAGDGAILAWVRTHTKPERSAEDIAAWSAALERWAPESAESRAFFEEVRRRNAPERTDIATWFDWLDLDDHVSFGGQP